MAGTAVVVAAAMACGGVFAGNDHAGKAAAAGTAAKAANAAKAAGAANNALTDPLSNPAGADASAQAAAELSARTALVPTNVTLPTGEAVRVDGTTVTPLKPTTSPFISFVSGGDAYAVPASAVKYFGSTLDPRLFDVSYLARTGGKETVKVTTDGKGSPLPAGRSALTAKTATKLGAQVESQKLTGVERIDLVQQSGSGAPALPAALPLGPQASTLPAKPAAQSAPLAFERLTINTIDRTGAAGEAYLIIQNVDDGSLAAFIAISEGSTSFTVPEGTYSVAAAVLTPDSSAALGRNASLVTDPELTLRAAKTITLDARTAVPYQPTLDPSLVPSDGQRLDSIGFYRGGADGSVQDSGGSGLTLFNVVTLVGLRRISPAASLPPIYVAPAGPVHTGTFDFNAETQFSDAAYNAGSPDGTSYLLDFSNPGRIPDRLDQQVTAAQLTSVRNTIYGDDHLGAGETYSARLVTTESWGTAFDPTVEQTPGVHTDYWYAASGSSRLRVSAWEIDPGAISDSPELLLDTGLYTQRPGGVISNDWFKGPRVPAPAGLPLSALEAAPDGTAGPEDDDASHRTVVCGACRQGDTGWILLDPATDSDPSHFSDLGDDYMYPGQPQSSVSFWRNGVLAYGSGAAGNYMDPADILLPLLPQRANYELDWKTTRYDALGLPTADQGLTDGVDTDWQFSSAPTARPGTLPTGMQCAPDPSQRCDPLPLLFVNYDLPVDYQNAAPAGQPFTIGFTVSPQQGAPALHGVSATVAVSFDDGTTWSSPQPATTGKNGEFTTTIQNPAAGSGSGYVSLRVTATDAAGDSVRQTVTRAYALTTGD